MTEVLAVEWARFNINVTGIAPGAFSSEMMDGMVDRLGDFSKYFPRQRMGDPAQLDSTLLYLCSTGLGVRHRHGHHGRRRPGPGEPEPTDRDERTVRHRYRSLTVAGSATSPESGAKASLADEVAQTGRLSGRLSYRAPFTSTRRWIGAEVKTQTLPSPASRVSTAFGMV